MERFGFHVKFLAIRNQAFFYFKALKLLHGGMSPLEGLNITGYFMQPAVECNAKSPLPQVSGQLIQKQNPCSHVFVAASNVPHALSCL
jgi:hypothetical protein